MTILTLALVGGALAADHIDGPNAAADPAVDITDVFAWHEGGRLYAVLNFAGAGATTTTGMYDADALYGIHIDTDDDASNGAERTVWIRFGEDAVGNWGVQVTNFPGAGAPVVGPVESVITAPGGHVFVGVRNDPFYFDFAGFQSTISTGNLAFTGADFFAGLNVTSIVLDMDANVAAAGGDHVNVWGTSARRPITP
ncbi:MAG: DUF4331 family protein [Alphaproteobacteria bacterium]|nr:DUF4331 family protein [Alphaproteobacteria bacterium]